MHTAKPGDGMKLVMAIIKPFKLGQVRLSVTLPGCEGMAITEVKGYSRHKGHIEIYRGADHTVNFFQRSRSKSLPHFKMPTKRLQLISAVVKIGRSATIRSLSYLSNGRFTSAWMKSMEARSK